MLQVAYLIVLVNAFLGISQISIANLPGVSQSDNLLPANAIGKKKPIEVSPNKVQDYKKLR